MGFEFPQPFSQLILGTITKYLIKWHMNPGKPHHMVVATRPTRQI